MSLNPVAGSPSIRLKVSTYRELRNGFVQRYRAWADGKGTEQPEGGRQAGKHLSGSPDTPPYAVHGWIARDSRCAASTSRS